MENTPKTNMTKHPWKCDTNKTSWRSVGHETRPFVRKQILRVRSRTRKRAVGITDVGRHDSNDFLVCLVEMSVSLSHGGKTNFPHLGFRDKVKPTLRARRWMGTEGEGESASVCGGGEGDVSLGA